MWLPLPVTMGGIGVSLSLVLALVTLSSSDAGSGDPQKTKCDLSGLWRNELGSLLKIHEVNEMGEFTGQYLTVVTATSNCIQNSPLKGVLHRTKAETSPVFGFTVNWEFSNSTTVFVGQCFVDARGNETLKTTWLLREEVGSLGDDWKATRVGTNDFTRELKLGQIPQNHSPQCGTPAPLSP